MLNRAWLTVVLVLLVVAILFRQGTIVATALILALTLAASWLWGRYALFGVRFSRRLSQDRAFFGEEVTLDLFAENRKLLPLAWLRLEDEFPRGLVLAQGRAYPSAKPQRLVLRDLLTLRWYERVTRRYRLICDARGEHVFGPGRIETGDVFGFVRRTHEVDTTERLVVYPRLLPLVGRGLPSNEILGSARARHRLFEDPLQVAGVREYQPGDPLRRVHWKISARRRSLQSKVLEPTTTPDTVLFLNVSTADPPWLGANHDRLELAIMVAAAIANRELQAGNPVGLFANGNAYGADQPVRIPSASGEGQLSRVLTALARMIQFESTAFPTLLQREARMIPWSAALVVISSVMTESLATTLLHLRQVGRQVGVILVGDGPECPVLPGIPVLQASGEKEWRELAAIHLS